MRNITTTKELKDSIEELRIKEAQQWQELKTQFGTTCEALKPINMLKNVLKEAQEDPDIKKQLLHAAVDMGINYLIKKANTLSSTFSGLDFLKNIFRKSDEKN